MPIHQTKIQTECLETFRLYLQGPAFAVYRQVLNLHVQVGPYLETPPWLRPIALFLIKLRTLLVGIGSKREGDITNKEGLYCLYHTPNLVGR